MAADVLKSTAVILFNFCAIPTVSATNPPQTQSTLTLYEMPCLRVSNLSSVKEKQKEKANALFYNHRIIGSPS